MNQIALFDTCSLSTPEPKSVTELAKSIGMSLTDFLQEEFRRNAAFWGISYQQQTELSLAGHKFPWIRLTDFIAGNLPERGEENWAAIHLNSGVLPPER
jgi:hypothetical protein